MSYYELLKESPASFVVLVLVSLIVTVLVYGAFPIIFANIRKTSITKKKYKRLCYGLNIVGMIFFIVINGKVSGGAYFLWTWILSNYGVKVLEKRKVLDTGNVIVNRELGNDKQERISERPITHIQPCPNPHQNSKPTAPNKTKSHKTKKTINKKLIVLLIVTPLTIAIILLLIIFFLVPEMKYNHAKKLLEEGNYELAYTAFLELDDFSDSEDMLRECRYIQAIKYRDIGDYELANKIFESLGNYRDSQIMIHKHDYRIVTHTSPTCTEAGSEVLECLGCKDSYTNYLKASHNYIVTETIDSSCTAAGNTSFECTICHDTYSEAIVIKSHNYSSATCTTPKTCRICGKTDGSALGHSTSGVKCSRCGDITFDTLTYSGNGSDVMDYSVPKGRFKITVTMTSGNGSIDVKVHYSDSYGDSFKMFNIFDAGNSEVAYLNGSTSGTIVVNASDSYWGNSGWKITIEAVEN